MLDVFLTEGDRSIAASKPSDCNHSKSSRSLSSLNVFLTEGDRSIGVSEPIDCNHSKSSRSLSSLEGGLIFFGEADGFDGDFLSKDPPIRVVISDKIIQSISFASDETGWFLSGSPPPFVGIFLLKAMNQSSALCSSLHR